MAEATKDRSDYQRDYYERQKEALSLKRKERYRSDPEARRKSIEASRTYRLKKKAERDAKIARGEIPVGHKTGPRKPVLLKVGGKKVNGYTITVLAERLSRSADTVNKWISSGVIPATPFRSKRDDRLYTDGMILVVKLAIQSRGIVRKDGGARDEIIKGWHNLGINI